MPKRTRVVVVEDDDILDALRDLHKQATTERSHFYAAKCCNDAIEEITELRARIMSALDCLHHDDAATARRILSK